VIQDANTRRAITRGIPVKEGLCARGSIQIYVDSCESRETYPGVFQERTARATGGGLILFTEIAESFTCSVGIMGIGCIRYSLFVDVGEGKTDNGLGRGEEGEVGTFELLDRLMMSVPPSRMLLRAFNIANNEFM